MDPKLAWALRHPEVFPVDINKADYEMLLRVPGIGVKSAKIMNRFPRVTLSRFRAVEENRSGHEKG